MALKHLYFTYIFALLSILFSACARDFEEFRITRLDGSEISTSELDRQIRDLVDTAGVTGLAVTIFNADTVVYQQAFGWANRETQDSLQLNRVFYGASLSKSVFGFLVAQLADEGIIDLDRPLQEYLDVPIPEMKLDPEWRELGDLAGDDRYKLITARMCMSHTTGLPNWRWITREGEFNPEGKLYFYFDPGTDYSYSGEGMMLLQYVIESITGKELGVLAGERIFDPLGMEWTSYIHEPRFDPLYCNGHTKTQDVVKKDISDEEAAAGSLSTTVVDYARFMEHMLALENRQSPVTRLMFEPNIRITSRKQFGPGAREKTDENTAIDLSYGLGWGRLVTPYGPGYFKEGHGEGFQHYSIIFAESHSGILLMSNSDNAESIFRDVLALGIGDRFTPWFWEDYIPWDHNTD